MAPKGGKRGIVDGWSPGAVRRHKRWLYSIRADDLDGVGTALTLTLRDTPATSDDWSRLLALFLQSLRDQDWIYRWHWVVEWQRRKTPHLHLAIYADRDASDFAIRRWLALTQEYGTEPQGQHHDQITGVVGWLKYLSKHASRGVHHYQRQGKPPGWEKTGRLWGKGGEWPTSQETHGLLTEKQFHRVRRMCRSYAVAEARSRSDWKALAYCRRMLKIGTVERSYVRGVSEWIPEATVMRMLELVGWNGVLAQPSAGRT